MVIDIVLFDLGGVLVELPGLPAVPAADAAHQAELWQHWMASPWVRSLEAGQCSPEEFGAGMVADWGLDLTPEQYLAEFEAWPRGLYPGAADVIRSLRPDLRTGCLSNSNPVHWPGMRDEMGLGELLDIHFLSYEIGHVKPEPEIFRHALERLSAEPEAILFLDDNAINILAASEAGMQAEHTVGLFEAREALSARGLLI